MAGEYDREFTSIVDRRAQLRIGFSTGQGNVTRFFVQLEYWLDGDWHEVARFDHDPRTPMGHDLKEEGLHMAVFRDGGKFRTIGTFPPVGLNRSIRYCTIYLRENADHLIGRFEKWHNVDETDR